VKFWRFVVTN